MKETEYMLARKYELQVERLNAFERKLKPDYKPALIEDDEVRELVRYKVSRLNVEIRDKFRALFEEFK